MAKLTDYTPDSRNANKGTAVGQKAIVNSVHRSGLGRSILVDRNGRIIGGNKTTEATLEAMGADVEVIEIETTGQQLVAVKRVDLDLDDPDPNNPARQLAYADNLTSWASFALDADQVMADIEDGFDFEAIDISLPDLGELLGGVTNEFLDTPPSLDDLEDKYGEPGERDFWPFIRVQVSPETMEKWQSLMDEVTETDDEAKKVEIILSSIVL